MELSYWEKQQLCHQNQIAVIGCGIVGLTTAIYLKRKAPKLSVTVYERGGLPSGASTKNAGFACFGSVSEILDDLTRMQRNEVISLIQKRYEGLQRLLSLVRTDEIAYEANGGYEIFTKDQEATMTQCLERIEECNQMVVEATGKARAYAVTSVDHRMNISLPLIYNRYEGQLNPFKLVNSLFKEAVILGVKFMYNCEVKNIDTDRRIMVDASGTEISYQQLVVCTNGFASRLLPGLDVLPARNQVLMTQPCSPVFPDGSYHYHKGYVYFRNYDRRVLLGGGRHLDMDGETTDEFGNTPVIMEFLKSFLYDTLCIDKKVGIEHYWSGIMGVGSTKETMVTECKPGHYIGVRLGGMGVALGSSIGYELANMVIAS